MRAKASGCVFLLAAVMTVGPGTSWAASSSQDREGGQTYNDTHQQDYSKNKNYQQGMRDGRDDNAHNRDHSKKRHFKKDDDQKAYEYGYQQGHQNYQGDHH